jgi:uncharacterized CHY-type Zn-finger protein
MKPKSGIVPAPAAAPEPEAAPDPNRLAVHWSPRVPKQKIRRLYERTCQGIWDDALIDDVGMTLYERCRDILTIHRIHRERLVACPRCDGELPGEAPLIPLPHGIDVPIVCPACGWAMTWRDYHRTFQRQQLNPGGAVEEFERFVRDYARAREARDKMLAIDRVIHAFHYSLRTEPDRPTRPAGVNLIDGRLADVVPFLDDLSGLDLPDPLRATHREWRESLQATYWPGYVHTHEEVLTRRKGKKDAQKEGQP